MRKVVFRAHAGMCGTDAAELVIVEDSVTDEMLDQDAHHFGLDHAATYGIYPLEDAPEGWEDEDSDNYDPESYTDGIEGWWEEYNPEKHDGIL